MKRFFTSVAAALVATLAFVPSPANAANATLTAGTTVAVSGQNFMSYSGGYLWQASTSSNTIKITNTTALTTITSSALPSNAVGIFGSGTNAWVALQNGNLSRISSSGTVITTITTGCATYSFNNRIHASADYASLSCFGDNKVISISASTNTIISQATTYSPFASFVRGSYTYVVSNSYDRISRYVTTDMTQAPRVTGSIGLLYNMISLSTVDYNYMYVVSQNTSTNVKVTRYSFSDGTVSNISIPGTSGSYSPYTGIASDNTNLFIAMNDSNKILSFDFNDSNGPTIADATTALSSVNGALVYDGTYIWGLVNNTTVRFSGASASKQLQPLVNLSVSPTSANGTGGTFSSAITVSSSGGAGTGAVTYAIDPASTASGCALDSNTAPTTVTATSAGTCLIYAVRAGDSTYEAEYSAPSVFTFTTPTVSAVSPTSGSVLGGTSITITGTGFASGATVTVGGNACTSVVVVSSTSITCVTPAGTTGAKSVVVTNTDASTATRANGFTYTMLSPTVTGTSPNSGSVLGGTSITITGTAFAAGATVTVGGNACTSVVVVSATSITCVVPAGTAGAKSVVVTNADSSTATRANGFTYTMLSPTVTAASPATIDPAGGTSITITGTAFAAGATVTVGGNACTSVVVVSATSITCVVPAGTVGAAAIVVTNTDTSTATGSSLLTYQLSNSSVQPPAITSVVSITGSGSSRVITGRLMAGVTKVFVNGVEVKVVSKSDGRIEITGVPALAPGLYDITIVSDLNTLNWVKAYQVAADFPRPVEQPAKTTSVVVAGFAGGSSRLTQSQKSTIQNLVAGATSLVCVGSTSNSKVTAADKALAQSRAQAACNFASSINKDLRVSIRIAPSSGVSSSARNVTLIRTGN